MKAVGIIAEYNPFHNGHLYQLEQAKALSGADYTVAVMSGDYTQRGAPAIYEKSLRAESALRSGVDLVLEMPVFGAVSPAADFAECGVSLLNAAGVTDFLCFGSESGDLSRLSDQAALADAETEEVSLALKKGLKEGLTWPQARDRAYREANTAENRACQNADAAEDFACRNTDTAENRACRNADAAGDNVFRNADTAENCARWEADTAAQIPGTPNDILAVEYLRALKRTHSAVRPLTVRRKGPGYHDSAVDGPLASASAARKAIAEHNGAALRRILPASHFEVFGSSENPEACPAPALTFNDFSFLLSERLLTADPDRLLSVSSMPDDLARKLYRKRLEFKTAAELAVSVKDRQYTYTRVCRCLLNLALGITAEDTARFKEADSAPWLRIVGFRRDAAPLLSELKKRARVPIITKTADAAQILPASVLPLWEKHLLTSELYRLAAETKSGRTFKNEFTRSPVIV